VTLGESTSFVVVTAIEEALQSCRERQPVPILLDSDRGVTVTAGRDRFIAVIGHLIQNAQEATPADGRVEVQTHQDGSMAVVRISDTGCGMDEYFVRERLFRPFNTTKGNAGMGIGVYESREFVHALGGEVDVTSKTAVGTTFLLRLPATVTRPDIEKPKQAARCPIA
ncbi:MAG: ATP-binding protein, partial [Candidatus Competibacteraceae bacterium]|nr:ATP-binding protein [Candidatus Competibacteraceae bacterium]